MDLFARFFSTPFYNRNFSMPELRKYGAAQLAALIADTPTGLSASVADLTTCLANFDATLPEVIGSGGALSEAVQNKKLFRKALAAKVTKIHSGIAAIYGDPSAELTGAFPNGRTCFAKCEDVDVVTHLTALKNWFTPAHVTAVGAAHQTSANGLVTQWAAIWAALQAAKGELSSDRGSRDEVKLAYQDCLFRVLLNLALKFPNDEAKFHQYVPQHLLEDAGSRPDAPVLTGEFNAEELLVHFTKSGGDGGTSFRLERSTDGGVTWFDNGPVDEDTFTRGDLSPGTYQYRIIASNDVGDSEPSAALEIVVP